MGAMCCCPNVLASQDPASTTSQQCRMWWPVKFLEGCFGPGVWHIRYGFWFLLQSVRLGPSSKGGSLLAAVVVVVVVVVAAAAVAAAVVTAVGHAAFLMCPAYVTSTFRRVGTCSF